MSKKKLIALLETKKTKKTALVARSQESTDVNEVRSIAADIEGINSEIEELRGIIEDMPEDHNENWQGDSEGEKRAISSPGGFNPIASYSVGQAENRNDEDIHSTLEYREAFKDYIISGVAIPDKFKTEERADALTTVGDIGAVIPTTIMNKVIEDMTVEGKILSRITQTAFQGGLSIPLSDINPEATWLTDESTVSDEQKAKMDAKITFGYHVLEAKVSIGLLTATVALPVFENIVVKQLKKAMIRAIETAIVRGTGSGQPKGFTKYDYLPEEQIITMNATEIGTIAKWAEVEAAIPEVVEDTIIHMMAKPTWEKYLNGMVDANGQKIGLGKINEKGQRILNGKEVLLTDKLPSFDAAQEGEIFAVEIDLSQYLLNSNLAMYYKKYFNEDKNKWIHKCLLIADGQMCIGKTNENKVVGAQGLIYIKKGAITK